MRFSVIIPALNEEKVIANAIAAVKRQDIPRDQFEIIVVDNNSHDNTIAAAHAAGANIVVKESIKGTNRARNRGIQESSGDVLVFLDADCEPHTAWLSQIDVFMRTTRYGAISGPYDYGFTGIHAILAKFVYDFSFENVGPIMTFLFRKPVSAMMGGNFAVMREAIKTIGGFPEIEFWGDDTAIAMKLMAHNKKVLFTHALKIKSSDRRFKEHGLIKPVSKYFYHFFKTYFTFKV